MGGDGRLMERLRVPGVEVATPDHLDPDPAEDLPSYAARVARRQRIGPDDVVGGASFGGMLAAEIARQNPVAGLILLGSSLHPERLPWTYKWVEKLGKWIPDVFLGIRTWPPLVHMRFSPVAPEALLVIVQMAKSCPPSQLRGFGRMALGWQGAPRLNCPLLSIHGDRDRIIPLRCAEPGLVLKDAGHAFTLMHVPETVAALSSFLGKLP
jgi:pimeloyl-ACP methyl ester carboxylesterase